MSLVADAQFDGRVFTRCRPDLQRGEVVGSAPHGMNVKLTDGTFELCAVPAGDYRVVRVHDNGFWIKPHTPRHRGNFKGFLGDRFEPKMVRRNPK